MIDQSTVRGRIISSALSLAAAKKWGDVTLADIADAAGVPLAEMSDEFDKKAAILAALIRDIDQELLRRAPKRLEGQELRDALFDVIMTRFDILAPHKNAFKSIYAAGTADFSLAGPLLQSMRWMLEAAGISTDGHSGRLRIGGLAAVYASVFRTWLDDDDPGLARTMAALDRRLRGGERTLRTVEQVGSMAGRLVRDGPAFLRSVLRGRPASEKPPSRDSGTV